MVEGTRRLPRREAMLALLLPAAIAAIGILVLSWGDLDERLVDPFYDAQTGTWPLKGSFWTGTLTHRYGQYLVIALGLGALAVLLAGRWLEAARRWRRPAAFLLFSILLPALVVAGLKYTSVIPCPWSAARYGGEIPHWGVFETPTPGTRPGHCFPGAHAASGFSLMCFYYLLRERSARLGWCGLAFGALIGTVFSVGQVARGAHFPSHNLWSMLIAWGIVSLLYWIVFRGRLLGPSRGDRGR